MCWLANFLLTFVLLNKLMCILSSNFQPIRSLGLDCYYKFTNLMANNADPDQLASSEANWSGAALFAKTGYIWVQQDKGWNCKLSLKIHKRYLAFPCWYFRLGCELLAINMKVLLLFIGFSSCIWYLCDSTVVFAFISRELSKHFPF